MKKRNSSSLGISEEREGPDHGSDAEAGPLKGEKQSVEKRKEEDLEREEAEVEAFRKKLEFFSGQKQKMKPNVSLEWVRALQRHLLLSQESRGPQRSPAS